MFRTAAAALALSLAGLAALPASAAELIGSYRAYIGRDDLYNSQGKRLTEVWQVLRQDRANLHRYGVRQPGDQGDPWFGDAGNRDAMERMVMAGRIDRSAARAILAGDVMVEVSLYGMGGVATHVQVSVLN